MGSPWNWVLALGVRKTKMQVWLIPIADERVGVQVKLGIGAWGQKN